MNLFNGTIEENNKIDLIKIEIYIVTNARSGDNEPLLFYAIKQ